MRTIRILDIGDMQNGFLQQDGSLSIRGSHTIIPPANAFLQAARDGLFDHTFVVMDTHFAEEYARSEESRQFPIHCEYGTRDWELAVDVSGLPNIRYLMKNRFSMWEKNEASGVRIGDPRRRMAYENLFRFVSRPPSSAGEHGPGRVHQRHQPRAGHLSARCHPDGRCSGLLQPVRHGGLAGPRRPGDDPRGPDPGDPQGVAGGAGRGTVPVSRVRQGPGDQQQRIPAGTRQQPVIQQPGLLLREASAIEKEYEDDRVEDGNSKVTVTKE